MVKGDPPLYKMIEGNQHSLATMHDTKESAQRTAKDIRRHWRKRGYKPDQYSVKVVKVGSQYITYEWPA